MTTREQAAELLQAILGADRRKRTVALKVLKGDVPLSGDPDQPLMMKAGPAARFLGVSKATFWRLVYTGRLTSVRITNKATFFRRRDLEALVNAGSPVPDPSPLSETATQNQEAEEK